MVIIDSSNQQTGGGKKFKIMCQLEMNIPQKSLRSDIIVNAISMFQETFTTGRISLVSQHAVTPGPRLFLGVLALDKYDYVGLPIAPIVVGCESNSW